MGMHPFTADIMDTPLLGNWRMSVFKKYDGSTNLDKHINMLVTQMVLYMTNNAIWCKVHTSLKGATLR